METGAWSAQGDEGLLAAGPSTPRLRVCGLDSEHGEPEMQRLDAYPFFSGPRPRLFGHRGAAGMAPENTLISFERALHDGATAIELDVQESRDGTIVVLHDDTLERTTDGVGPVRGKTFAQLIELDAGFRYTPDGRSYPYRSRSIRIPALEEYLSRFPQAKTIVEIKKLEPESLERLVDLIESVDAIHRVLLASESDVIMEHLRHLISDRGLPVPTGCSYKEIFGFFQRLWGAAPVFPKTLGHALQIPCAYEGKTLITQETVAAAHDLGMEVHAWTINDPDQMEQLFSWGVDGIVTDYPLLMADRLRQGDP